MKKIILGISALMLTNCGNENGNGSNKKKITKNMDVIQVSEQNHISYSLGQGVSTLVNGLHYGFKQDCVKGDQKKLDDPNETIETVSIKMPSLQVDLNGIVQVEYEHKTKLALHKFSDGIKDDASYLNAIDMDENNVYAIVSIRKWWKPLELENFTPNEETLVDLKDDPTEFYNRCGNEYIVTVTPVVEAYGIVECKDFDGIEKSKFSTIVRNGSGLLNGKITTDTSNTIASIIDDLNNIKSDKKCTLKIIHRGNEETKAISYKDFASSATSYVTNSKKENAVLVNVTTASYDNVIDNKVLLDLKDEKRVTDLWHRSIKFLMEKIFVYGVTEETKKNEFTITDLLLKVRTCHDNPITSKNCQSSDGDILDDII
jgi:hypothetical protein